MSGRVAYLDSSALVKLVVSEPESRALFEFLADWPDRVVSALARVEVPRALARAHASRAAHRRAQATLAHVVVIGIDDDVLSRAARVEPRSLRSLDALHLATAIGLGEDLGVFVTYDDRLAAAAARAALRVEAPG
ncbi:MAG: type II toxin-antitoxin system VapC family toxin [Deltaproteobacteria bacterium]|nr:type II toxin-antitoxin system VapC family toxin [Deltaproteobacteria bacterium]